MAIAKNRIHIICGICGSNNFFSFEITEEPDDDNEKLIRREVIISCANCSSITGLDELMKDKTKKTK